MSGPGGLARTRSRTFDALDRLAKSIGAKNQTTKYAYDGNSNPIQITDPLANIDVFAYDALDRLITHTDPGGNTTQYRYDANDNLTQVLDPLGAATNYSYDGLGNLLQTDSPDAGTTQNTYDAAGNLLTATDARGKTTRYTYDALGRVVGIGFASGTPIAFAYDGGANGIGRLTGMTDESGSTAWTYDSHGRATTKVQTVGTVVQTLAYAYDAAGRVSQITYPSGKKIGVAYDAAGRVANLTLNAAPLLSNIQYSPFGAVLAWTWGNGQGYQRTLDLDGRWTQYPLAGRSRALAYDKASRIVDYTDTDTTRSQHFEYDALDRLVGAALNPTAAFGAGQTRADYGYDVNGNRVLETQQAATTLQTAYAYGPGNNRLVQVTPPGGVAVGQSYDAAGNLLADGTNTFAYNDRGRLARANTTQYLHNGLGQRVKKSGSGTRLFVYDGAGHLIGEYNANGVILREVVYLGDTPVVALGGANAAYYVYADHLDAPRALVDATNKVVWRWDSEPFGAELPNEDPDGDGVKVTYNWRFPGQVYDAETGLNYNYLRDYNPVTGRYLESDPVGLRGGVNTYAYVGGNPVGSVDSLGLLEVGYGQNILNLPDGAAIPNGAVSMDGPGSPLGVAETASNLAPEAKIPFVAAIKGIRIGAGWKARNIADVVCENGCEAIARQIQRSIGGDIARITPKDNCPYLGKFRGKNWKWSHHEVVVKDGRVYDLTTGHEGLPVSEYKGLWEFAGDIDFNF